MSHIQTLTDMMAYAEKRAASSRKQVKNLCNCNECSRTIKARRASALALAEKFEREYNALYEAIGRMADA